jgi:putative ABC transport system substrate-binding protein
MVANDRFGSEATDFQFPGRVRFSPNSGRIATLRQSPPGQTCRSVRDNLPRISAAWRRSGTNQMAFGIGRRRFMSALGGAAAAWPLAARAQQATMPVIGFLDSRSPEALVERLRSFRKGLNEIGFVEGETVAIEYRWGENQNDRLPDLAADLVRRHVAVLVPSGGNPVNAAAKAATSTIPIVFLAAEDPVKLGLVASLAHPGGNLTGINFLNTELAAKQLELLHDMAPKAVRVAVLIDSRTTDQSVIQNVEAAGRTIGVQLQILSANTSREIDMVFETSISAR